MEGNSTGGGPLSGLAQLGLVGQCALLALITFVSYLVVAVVAYSLKGSDGCLAAGVAALLPLTGSELALVSSRLGVGPSAAIRGLALGMLLRLGVPLAGSLLIRMRGGRILEAGGLYYLIVFYLVTLAAEVGFEVARVPDGFPSRRRSQG